ncbi:MAG: NAD(P)/FAD-dependent oxidoreductase [Gammaproteobacteria bacterium]|nr:NAD(P)/FAD-dependent oxidoreductase [Gammaproteobacteria bacterium]
MSKITRRNFVTLAGGTLAASAMGFPMVSFGASKHVVIVGGGIGGSTAAKYIRMADSSVKVTVIEANKHYHTCFMSNEVIGGNRDLDSIKFGYGGLRGHGVDVIHDLVTDIDPVSKKVMTKGGKTLSYDACIVSPGISFKWDNIEGYDEATSHKIPHAWKAGPQTALLRDQVKAMKNGGTVIIAAPPNPFRCPPGPYERASQIAWYLKKHKPKSKILILDQKPKFSKMGLFTAGWERNYGYNSDNSMIEWVSGESGGKVTRVNAGSMTASSDVGDFKGDVMNVIPAQKAGAIAFKADLVDDKGWCPVNQHTFESTKHKDIYVVGDASVASPLPKSGYAANSEAKVCAAAIVAKLNGKGAPGISLVNTCYSIITPDEGISVAMVYRLGEDGKIMKVKGSGGLTPGDASPGTLKREVAYAHSWFKNITHDVFG